MTAAAFRMRWVAIAASGSLRGALKFGAAGEFLSVGSGSSSRKSAIGHAIRHCRQRLSAKPSFPLHNVVRLGGGRSITRCCGRLNEIKVAARTISLQNTLTTTMLPPAQQQGSAHWLVSPILLAISVTLGSSVVYRWPKSLMRLASARRASISGRPTTFGHGMRTCRRCARY
jgi:hypothetical protein